MPHAVPQAVTATQAGRFCLGHSGLSGRLCACFLHLICCFLSCDKSEVETWPGPSYPSHTQVLVMGAPLPTSTHLACGTPSGPSWDKGRAGRVSPSRKLGRIWGGGEQE